jgi:hypothetical protein
LIVTNGDKPDQSKELRNYGYPAVILGTFLVLYVVYCFFDSDQSCIAYLGKLGYVKDCSDSRYRNLVNWGFFLFLGIGVVSLGISGIRLRKNKG